MKTLLEKLKSLFDAAGEGKAPRAKAVAKLIQEEAETVYHVIYNAGHGKATAEKNVIIQAKDAEIAQLKTDAETKDIRITELEKKTPELETIRQQYEDQIKTIKAEHKTAIEAKDGQIQSERTGRARSDLRAKLTKLDPLYAEVAVRGAEGRMRFNDKGELEVLQKGLEIPFVPSEGKSGLDLLADEITTEADPRWVTSNVDTGAGSEKGNNTPAGKDFFESIRTSAPKPDEKSQARLDQMFPTN